MGIFPHKMQEADAWIDHLLQHGHFSEVRWAVAESFAPVSWIQWRRV